MPENFAEFIREHCTFHECTNPVNWLYWLEIAIWEEEVICLQ